MCFDMQCEHVQMFYIFKRYIPGWAAASRFGHSPCCPWCTWLFSLDHSFGDTFKWQPFFGSGITGRGGSSSMSGSSSGLIPKTSKDLEILNQIERNLIKKLLFWSLSISAVFLKQMCTFSCTHIPHTHRKKGWAVFRNIPTVFYGGCLVLRGWCAI